MIAAAALLFLLQGDRFTVKETGGVTPGLKVEVMARVRAGVATIEKFFGSPYSHAFEVEVFANRKALDAAMKKLWDAPPTEKWMVAAGVSDSLLLLSPRVWKTEAQGHDGSDVKHVQEIVTHELTHVYHGQVCPKHDFDGMDKMAWFIEGLATYVAGQLEGRRLTAKQAIEAGQAPTSLESAWSGNYRYGICGSMVRYVDTKFGRTKLIELLKATDNASAMKALGVSESEFVGGWRRSVQSPDSATPFGVGRGGWTGGGHTLPWSLALPFPSRSGRGDLQSLVNVALLWSWGVPPSESPSPGRPTGEGDGLLD